MKYIRKFATEAEYNAASADLPTPNIVLIEENMSDADGGIILNKYVEPTHNYANDYLTLVAGGDGDLNILLAGTNNDGYYSLDEGETWTALLNQGNDNIISLSNGDRVLIKNTSDSVNTDSNNMIMFNDENLNHIPFSLEGNIMSFIYGDNFVGQTTFPQKQSEYYYSPLQSLFTDCAIEDVTNLVLPATTIPSGYYEYMLSGDFDNITCLATTIANDACTGWLGSNIPATGTFTKAAGAVWPSGAIPNGWTVVEV